MPYSAIPNKPNFMILGIVEERFPAFFNGLRVPLSPVRYTIYESPTSTISPIYSVVNR